MSKPSFFALAVVTIMLAGAARADVDEGGDVVVCRAADGSLRGTPVPLDLFQEFGFNGATMKVRASERLEEGAILGHLGFPGLAQSSVFFNVEWKPDMGQSYVRWQEAPFGFAPVNPAQRPFPLPAACPGGKTEILHLFVKRPTPSQENYEFDGPLRRRMKETAPTLYHMALMREWLARFTDDGELIRKINRLWHEEGLLQSAPRLQELRRLFELLVLQPKTPTTPCQRSLFILESLQRALGRHCQAIAPADLANLRTLEIVDLQRQVILFDDFVLRKADLAGLSNLETLVARKVQWLGPALSEGIFASTPKLRRLLLQDSFLKRIGPGTFAGLRQLEELNLYNADLDVILPGTFKGIFSENPRAPTALILGGPMQGLEEIRADMFAGLENLKVLSMLELPFQRGLDLSVFSSMRSLEVLEFGPGPGANALKLTGVLESSRTPRLRSLSIRRADRALGALGPLPSLQEMAITMASSQPLTGLERFPGMRSLDLSGSQWMLREGVKELSKLNRLETLIAMNTMLYTTDGTNRIYLIADDLPQGLRRLDICAPLDRTSAFGTSPADFWRTMLREARLRNPNLVVRTKNNCQGDWIEVPR